MRALVTVIVALAASLALGCRASPVAPSPAAGPAVIPSTDLSGTWNGSGADAQGPESLSMTIAQTGTSVSGTVVAKAVNPADGSCASCHKNKIGTFTGTLSGTSLRLNLSFPAGSDAAPTPMCSVTIAVTSAVSSNDTIAGSYTGADSCEGPFTGTLTISRPSQGRPIAAAVAGR